MSAADHIQRIREALEHVEVSGIMTGTIGVAAAQQFLLACSPEAMRAIIDELADREHRIESALSERNRMGVELEGARIRLADMTAERDKLAADLAAATAFSPLKEMRRALEQQRAQMAALREDLRSARKTWQERDDMHTESSRIYARMAAAVRAGADDATLARLMRDEVSKRAHSITEGGAA